jgi:menaquinone-dependent protoporphyrinogen oxidase
VKEVIMESTSERDTGGTPAGETRPRILVVCATRHGSTTEVAEAIAEELRGAGADADVRPAPPGADAAAYDAVVIGGPMIMGWHRAALRYIARNREKLAAVPTAYFITAAALTDTGDDQVDGVPIVIDTWLAKAPRDREKLGYKERYARPTHYLEKPLKTAPRVRPVSVAFFAGSLDLTKMNLFEKLFVMLVVGATPGDGRHWDAIREWARGLPALLTPRTP